MKKEEIDKLYINKFIQSMENDYERWKMNHCVGVDWAWTEYHSPNYENEEGRVSFGFSLNHDGAWINGHFQWSKTLLNPFSKTFWRFLSAKRKMKSYLKSKEKQEYLQKLNSIIN
jgi:hypothetical protein